jgi:PadR family transcriptional regulator, regulatory protein PadR
MGSPRSHTRRGARQLHAFRTFDSRHIFQQYTSVQHKDILARELKKGSAELLILSLVEHRPRHGYEISQVIETRSEGAVRFRVASLYPLLYRLEKRGWIAGRWVEKEGQRRRRYYRLTAAGKKILAEQRSGWQRFVAAITRISEAEHA